MVSVFKKKEKRRSLDFSLLWIAGSVFVLLILAGFIIADIRMYKEKKLFLSRVQGFEKEIKNLQEKNQKLKQGIEKSDDPDYIEKIAREELDLQKNGEKVVSFIMPQPKPLEAGLEAGGFTQKWLGWIGKIANWLK